jgi:hypothetical protein
VKTLAKIGAESLKNVSPDDHEVVDPRAMGPDILFNLETHHIASRRLVTC